jgi:hypothetical protein
MNNTFKRAFHLLWFLAFLAFVSTGMPGRSQDNGTHNAPSLSSGKTIKGSDWPEPDKIIPQLSYDGLPITEVSASLKELFNDKFDVLLPNGQQDVWSGSTVTLKLKNVKASEIFNAMNLVFQTGHTPLRWELMMNGQRPTALLHLVQDVDPAATVIDPATGMPLHPPAQEKPMVFFVGDLLGNQETGGMNMNQVIGTVTDVCRSANITAQISGHNEAQLIIVRGTEDDRNFVRDTLAALRERVRVDGERKAEAEANEPKPKTGATNKP